VLFQRVSRRRARVLPATSSPSARASIRPPATTSAVDGFYTCCGCTLRDDDDDFEEYSTAAIIDHLREHQAAGHTFHILTDAFDDLQADAAGNDAWIKTAGKDCRSRLQDPTPADVLAEVRVTQVRKIDCSTVEVTSRRNSSVRSESYRHGRRGEDAT
jgi:hypothetical protein